VATWGRGHLPFEEARAFVRSLGLNGVVEWRVYCESGKKRDAIPASPHVVYKDDWRGWGDWMGTGNVRNRDRE